jgi:hypothetical protein
METDTAVTPDHYVRSWYGLEAEVVVDGGLWHLVRLGRLALYHPPLVNLILRRGLPRRERLQLSFLHEFGHLQTLPVAVIHLLWLVVYGRWRRPGKVETGAVVLAAVVAHQATWELSSESYVIAKTGREYGRIYRKHPNWLGHIVFWVGMALLSTVLTRWITQKDKTAL